MLSDVPGVAAELRAWAWNEEARTCVRLAKDFFFFLKFGWKWGCWRDAFQCQVPGIGTVR